MKYVVMAVMFVGATGVWLSTTRAADEEKKPKFTTKEVMKLHKDKLHEKFLDGTATDEEKKKLLEGYEALVLNKPKKGEAEAWKKTTEALVKAVKDGDNEAFKTAVNCKACHDAHK